MHVHNRKTQQALTPSDARELLNAGNARFRDNLETSRNLLQQVNETRDGQWPFAAILGCIDSRTSPELIFDQGIGDIFSVRIAGNVVNDDILGSLEFACGVAGAKLVVVLGHSQCGAIKGACDGVELGHLSGLLEKIRPAIEAVAEPLQSGSPGSDDASFVDAVTEANVRRVVALVPECSDVLRDLLQSGAIDVVGALYDVGTGAVRFLEGPAAALGGATESAGAKPAVQDPAGPA
jgi:carbonic anhydrase